ncbi:hypothetical protein L2E82_25713 [Cichorium intybus]|uniref:Uncharacterized protein n=1 Tax=Cichorium intybus TaxID=13427 RepID=A0ACB9E3T0_CICIN|nr:hypothetical protein L2E82_25713 [Cichorium intybus]
MSKDVLIGVDEEVLPSTYLQSLKMDSKGVAKYIRSLVDTDVIVGYFPDEQAGKPSRLLAPGVEFPVSKDMQPNIDRRKQEIAKGASRIKSFKDFLI